MGLESSIYTYLAANGGVGAIAGDRIYPMNIPQDITLPAIAYQRVSGDELQEHTGTSRLNTGRVQFTCTATTYSEAVSLSEAVADCFNSNRYTMGDVFVNWAYVENKLDGWGPQREIYTRRVDIIFNYR